MLNKVKTAFLNLVSAVSYGAVILGLMCVAVVVAVLMIIHAGIYK